MSPNTLKTTRRRSQAEHTCAKTCAALGDETRLALLRRLCGGKARAGTELSITELSEGVAVTRQAVTKHLRALESAGLVRCRREGRESVFTFQPAPLNDLQDYLETVSRQWDSALARLKAFAEDTERGLKQ